MRKIINISHKDILWNYLGYGFSFGTNILLLPIILYYLPQEELGLWYVFLSVGAFVSMFDFGFSPQIARFITYAYAGVEKIDKIGVTSNALNDDQSPNFMLLNRIISTAKYIYLVIALIILVVLSVGGSFYIYSISGNKFTQHILGAWIIFILASFINVLYSYYTAIFRGIGGFVELNKALSISKLVQIALSYSLLVINSNIISVAIAYLISGVVFRFYLSHVFYRNTEVGYHYSEFKHCNTFRETLETFKIIWNNASKDGLVMISRYFVTQSNTILCSLYLGLSETASYALSVQILTVFSSISTIYYTTQHPILNSASVDKNEVTKYTIFSKSWTIFIVMYIVLVVCMITFGIPLVNRIKNDKILDINIFIFLAVYILLEANQSLFTSYISTSNYIPYSKAYCISAFLATGLAILLVSITDWGIMGLIFAHLIVQLSYNNWKWPLYVLHEFHTNLFILFRNGIKQLVIQFKDYCFCKI